VPFSAVLIPVVVSPGPNVILVANRSLSGPLSIGVWTAFGEAIGSGIYGLCGLLGWIEVLDAPEHFAPWSV
jgi:threonine/homoserine/homoserine lactone efflux protein